MSRTRLHPARVLWYALSMDAVFQLKNEFADQADLPCFADEQDRNSGSEADSLDTLALKPGNEFQNLMKRLKRLLDSGMEDDLLEAHEIAESTLLKGTYSQNADRMEQLLGQYDTIRERLAENPELRATLRLGETAEQQRKRALEEMLEKQREQALFEQSPEHQKTLPPCQRPGFLKPGLTV